MTPGSRCTHLGAKRPAIARQQRSMPNARPSVHGGERIAGARTSLGQWAPTSILSSPTARTSTATTAQPMGLAHRGRYLYPMHNIKMPALIVMKMRWPLG